jgi:hypothetical protein
MTYLKHPLEGYMKTKRANPERATIALYLGSDGVLNVAVRADNSAAQTRAHELLSLVTDELRALHLALLAAGIKQQLEDQRSRATLNALKESAKEPTC